MLILFLIFAYHLHSLYICTHLNNTLIMRNIFILLLVFVAMACSHDEPVAPVTAKLNMRDSAALIAVRDSLLTNVSFRYEWDFSKPEEMTGVKVKLDSVANEYRVTGLSFPSLNPVLTYQWQIDEKHWDDYWVYIPKSIGNLSELKVFYASGPILAPIPDEFFNCPLESLTIMGLLGPNGRFDDTSVPIDLIRLKPTIRRIVFVGCRFKNGLPEEILHELSDAPNLKNFCLNNCYLEGKVTPAYGLLWCEFDLTNNNFTEIDWELFENFTLNVPFLYCNKIDTKNIPPHIRQSQRWADFGDRLCGQR